MQPVLNRYLDRVIKDNQSIDARGVMQVNRMIELTMDEVFINLSVRMGRLENSNALRHSGIRLGISLTEEATSVFDPLNFDAPLANSLFRSLFSEDLAKLSNNLIRGVAGSPASEIF